ncbi:THUMP domain-containing protein [Stagonosporopsis vannaccii]|nr:THUMP domain-containing protein [Stagonosporopsis vannaccii]
MADAAPVKRKAESDARGNGDSKRSKGKKKWEMPRRGNAEARQINPGDVGIWATCAMKKEAPTVADLRDLFQGYAAKLYGEQAATGTTEADEDDSDVGGDIEAEINKELADIRKPAVKPLFTSVKLDTQCLVFFKTRAPVEPVSFVHKICQDTADGVQHKNCRFVKRLTPISGIEKANQKGLETVAEKVLAPHFHGGENAGRKFAIRPTIRNNKDFKRDDVIKTVAAAVGPGHKVDLHGYDLLIFVEIYKNIIGMSVVGSDFDKLKRYNIEELRQGPPDVSGTGAPAASTEST